MNKSFKKLICLILSCFMIFSMISCDYIENIVSKIRGQNDNDTMDNDSKPSKKYTGGFTRDSHFHAEYGVYWLETYDEVIEAVALLKSHGSTIKRSIGFNCEDESLDVKWCFTYKWSHAEPLEDGKSFFDRKIDNGDFEWYAFHKDVTIDELLYSDVDDYDDMYISYLFSTKFDRDFESVENKAELSFDWSGKVFGSTEPQKGYLYYVILYNGKELNARVVCQDTPIPIDYHEEFLSTFIIVE